MIGALIISVNENNYHPTMGDLDVETSACPVIGAPVDVLEHRAFLGKG